MVIPLVAHEAVPLDLSSFYIDPVAEAYMQSACVMQAEQGLGQAKWMDSSVDSLGRAMQNSGGHGAYLSQGLHKA